MQFEIQYARRRYNRKFAEAGKVPRKLHAIVIDAFNLGTIQGARAACMEDQIGRLTKGKLVDIVIFDAANPGMVCAGEHDPVAAIVLHASIRDIDTVIIDGIIRKWNAELIPTEISLGNEQGKASMLKCSEIAAMLAESKKKVQASIDALDVEAGKRTILSLFDHDGTKLVGRID